MSVLVALTPTRGTEQLVCWGVQLAATLQTNLVVLHFEKDDSPLASDVRKVCKRDPRTQHRSSEGGDDETSVTVKYEVVSATKADIVKEVLDKIEVHKCTQLLLARDPEDKHSHHVRTAVRQLFELAPCAVMLQRVTENSAVTNKTILVPTGGGPHADAALRLGAKLLDEDGELTALTVQPWVGDESRQLGEMILDRAIQRLGLDDSKVNRRVLLGNDVWKGVGEVAAEGFDLVLVGASHAGVIRKALLRTVPDQLLATRDHAGTSMAVVREKRPFVHRLQARIERWLDLSIPQLSREERVSLHEKLHSGSSWNFDFFVLISLSTLIASLGLLQDSGAVVIGAMLVAPLMTPLLGAGLALVQGNRPLVLTSIWAISFGFLTALGIGFIAGLCVPVPQLTGELAARGGPTILDLLVAFFSGLAAAHCSGRRSLSAALPGVAIAAALVPPIATAGVSLAIGRFVNAQGAALLFGTNVVAIILGASASFYAGGMRPRTVSGERRWVRQALVVLFLVVCVLAIPLSSVLFTQLKGDRQLTTSRRAQLEARVAEWIDHELTQASFFRKGEKQGLHLTVRAPAALDATKTAELAQFVRDEIGGEIVVRLETRIARTIAPAPPEPAPPR